ncbi:ABC transporter ATP-binding protein [Clostridium tarantellae]|uniref:ATP-binding cassette domain-containing protein n=1 Tax=Clostridium tarantellae TaxID=39493 RepID=A0A6I1MSM8_9CLOT|nr:ABC transporter ATP-binding protein [Clostridium tarantellae]MPQ43249.1 ATP-binding cassette domain-containing protein [Clostridium tarantellae]
MTYAIKVQNLCKKYKVYDSKGSKLKKILNPFGKGKEKEFQALTDVSFQINKGEIIGIIGNNGAGKSTLLKILSGVAFQNSGTCEVNGRISSLLELGTGFNPELTGIENIYFNGSLMGLTNSEIDSVKDNIIEFADIGEFVYQPVKTYSSGMYARLAFAVAINIHPDILIVDEILSVGDIAFQKKCMEKFDEFKKQNKTIIYVSHGLETVQTYCEKAIWLEKGKVKEIGPAFDVVEHYYTTLMKAGISLDDQKGQFVKLINIEIKNKKEKFNYGDKINFKIDYEVIVDNIENPGITLELRKAYRNPCEFRHVDQFICAVNSNVDNFSIPWNKGKNSIIFTLDSIRVKEGLYYIDVIFSESQNLVSLETVEGAIDFKVNNHKHGEGFVFLDEEWRI